MLRLTSPLSRRNRTHKKKTRGSINLGVCKDDNVIDTNTFQHGDDIVINTNTFKHGGDIVINTNDFGGHTDVNLKRCNFVDNIYNTIINIDGDGPLKRCKFINKVDSDSDSDSNSDSPWLWQPESEPSYQLKVGQTLDVIPFLSHHGQIKHLVRSNGDKVRFDVVRGKHLVICTVSLPILEGQEYFDSMITAYSELSRDDFEMVVVATVKPGCTNGDSLFNDFFSGLPCLAIPFSETWTRSRICAFIRLNLSSICEDASAVLVDPNQTILHYHSTLFNFHHFGSDWSPFLQSTVDAIEAQDEVLRIRLDPFDYKIGCRPRTFPEVVARDPLIRKPLSLHEDILLCDPSFLLPRIGSPDHAITVSELSNKYVGLYLCQDLKLMIYLEYALRSCITKEPELVILVVCVPIHESIDCIQKRVKPRFEKLGITGYFHPDNSKVWRRLWRVFGETSMIDEMVILPPNCISGELRGLVVIERLQGDGYPFARSTILDRRFTNLRSLTPASLFKGTSKNRTCLIRNGGKSNVCQSVIKGKRVLLYLDSFNYNNCPDCFDDPKLCRLLMEQYSKIQDMNWEVVFVPLDLKDKGEHLDMYAKMPWPIMPLRDAVETSVISQVIFKGMTNWNYVMAFEADGRMVSRRAKKRLLKGKIDESLFDDNLYEELFDELFSLVSYI